ncbi:MAG: LysM peptidoglycan-binding domain-containing protein [Desulfobacterales bacterium]|nr:LysM peptidoglycan-binding domain-containing protein [Desulfobacterales bacterium]
MKKIILFTSLALIVSLAAGPRTTLAKSDCGHRVVRGDTLWQISDTYLADPLLWPTIWRNNPEIKNPDLIFPEQMLRIPGQSTVCTKYQCVYQVVKGDTLWHISSIYLRDPMLWPRIWQSNPEIKDPDLIFPKQRIRVPCAEEKRTQAVAIPGIESSRPPLAPARPEPEKGLEIGPPAGTPGGPNPVLTQSEADSQTKTDVFGPGLGVVVKEPVVWGRVIGQDNGWSTAGANETLLIDSTGATVGQRYGVYRDLGQVRHPKTGKKMGHLVVEVGVVEVTALGSPSHTARIVSIFQEISSNDYLGPLPRQQVVPMPVDQLRPDLSGTVIALFNLRSVVAGRDILYLDRGAGDGLEPGDILYISKERNKKSAVRVIRVTDSTATAMVLPTTNGFVFPGDRLAAVP